MRPVDTINVPALGRITMQNVRCHLCLSVRLLETIVSPTKTDKPIEMSFGLWTVGSPRNHVLGGARIPPREGELLGKPTWECPDF